MDRTNICKNIIQSIKDYIMDPVKLEPHRAEKHFVRKRKLTLLHVIIYLLYSSKASMFQNLSRIRDELSALSFPDVSKQALSKARQFISPDLFKELFYLSVDLFYKHMVGIRLVSQTVKSNIRHQQLPSLLITANTVLKSIFISNPIFHSEIYSVSSLTISSKSVISLLPLTCHIPVIPGLMAILAL